MLDLSEKAAGIDLEVAINNLAFVYSKQRQFVRAESLYKRVQTSLRDATVLILPSALQEPRTSRTFMCNPAVTPKPNRY